MSGTTLVSRYQKDKTNLDFTGARDSEWQWHQLGHMQVCTLLQTDNHASTSLLSFLQAGCPSCTEGKNISVGNPSPTVGTLHGMISLTSGLCSLGAFKFDNTRVPVAVVMVVTVVK